jgi:uncharacterized paraquat-inducible protein A
MLFPKPRDAPAVIQRMDRRLLINRWIFILFMTFWIIAMYRGGPGGTGWAFVMMMAVAVLEFPLRGWADRDRRRLVEEVRTNDHHCCTNCGYCLNDLPDRHRCPECGIEYDMQALQRVWERYLSAPPPLRW